MKAIRSIVVILLVLAAGACGAISTSDKSGERALKVGDVTLQENFTAPSTRALVRAACDGDEAGVKEPLIYWPLSHTLPTRVMR